MDQELVRGIQPITLRPCMREVFALLMQNASSRRGGNAENCQAQPEDEGARGDHVVETDLPAERGQGLVQVLINLPPVPRLLVLKAQILATALKLAS